MPVGSKIEVPRDVRNSKGPKVRGHDNFDYQPDERRISTMSLYMVFGKGQSKSPHGLFSHVLELG